MMRRARVRAVNVITKMDRIHTQYRLISSSWIARWLVVVAGSPLSGCPVPDEQQR